MSPLLVNYMSLPNEVRINCESSWDNVVTELGSFPLSLNKIDIIVNVYQQAIEILHSLNLVYRPQYWGEPAAILSVRESFEASCCAHYYLNTISTNCRCL